MSIVKVLYDSAGHDSGYVLKSQVEKFNRSSELQIRLNLVTLAHDLFYELQNDPNYNFIVIHLGNSNDSAYRISDRCRGLTNAILVAESTLFPRGKEEVLRHFDEYIGLIFNDITWLTDLFKKHGF